MAELSIDLEYIESSNSMRLITLLGSITGLFPVGSVSPSNSRRMLVEKVALFE